MDFLLKDKVQEMEKCGDVSHQILTQTGSVVFLDKFEFVIAYYSINI